MLFKKLAESGVNYKPGDFKAEVHFLGQIIGASNVMEHDAIICEAHCVQGDQWRLLSKKLNIQTQACFVDENNFACFCHPFDLHYTTENPFGWPRLVVRLWKLGDNNKLDILSYGTTILPNTKGYHEYDFQTWCLKGSLTNEAMWFFLGSKPIMNTSDAVDANLMNRKNIISKPGPKVKISCEVILRNFGFHSISGAAKEDHDSDDDGN